MNYDYLLTQKTLDGNYRIYSYQRPGMMAFSGDISGIQIQKADTKFREREGLMVNGEILRYIGIDTLEVYQKKLGQQPTDTIPNIKYETAYDLTLKILAYDGHNGNASRVLYFDELYLSRNKIIFKGIRVNVEGEYRDDVAIDLGSIELETRSDTISKLKFKNLKASIDGRFKNKDGTFNENLPSIKIVTTYLIPTSKLSRKEYENWNVIFYNGE
jgi:hypothetical protein